LDVLPEAVLEFTPKSVAEVFGPVFFEYVRETIVSAWRVEKRARSLKKSKAPVEAG
jgi:hypothetical protein